MVHKRVKALTRFKQVTGQDVGEPVPLTSLFICNGDEYSSFLKFENVRDDSCNNSKVWKKIAIVQRFGAFVQLSPKYCTEIAESCNFLPFLLVWTKYTFQTNSRAPPTPVSTLNTQIVYDDSTKPFPFTMNNTISPSNTFKSTHYTLFFTPIFTFFRQVQGFFWTIISRSIV